jgi:hypothetical protein
MFSFSYGENLAQINPCRNDLDARKTLIGIPSSLTYQYPPLNNIFTPNSLI